MHKMLEFRLDGLTDQIKNKAGRHLNQVAQTSSNYDWREVILPPTSTHECYLNRPRREAETGELPVPWCSHCQQLQLGPQNYQHLPNLPNPPTHPFLHNQASQRSLLHFLKLPFLLLEVQQLMVQSFSNQSQELPQVLPNYSWAIQLVLRCFRRFL